MNHFPEAKLNELTFIERLILYFCKKPAKTHELNDVNWEISNSLDLYARVFDSFKSDLVDKNILDLGCGRGIQCLALASLPIKSITGVDTNPEILAIAKENCLQSQHRDKIFLYDKLSDQKFDLILSQNSFEHYEKPKEILELMFQRLDSGGKVMATFGPLWNSPYGSHFEYISKLPWLHKLLNESSMMRIRKLYRDDGAEHFRDIPGGMNCYSLQEFDRLFLNSKFKIIFKRLDTVKNLPFQKTPFLREYFVNHYSIILEKP